MYSQSHRCRKGCIKSGLTYTENAELFGVDSCYRKVKGLKGERAHIYLEFPRMAGNSQSKLCGLIGECVQLFLSAANISDSQDREERFALAHSCSS